MFDTHYLMRELLTRIMAKQYIYISYSHVESFETLETFQHDDIPIAILSLLLLAKKNTKNYMSIGPEIYSSHVSIDI